MHRFEEIKILVVDDDEDDYYLTMDLIRQIPDLKISTEWCYNYNDALNHLKENLYDLYFVDYRLGAKTGLDLLQEMSSFQHEPSVILLTGKGNRVIDIEAMKLGAVDYLVKDELSIDKLERSIRYAVERNANLKAIRNNETKFRNIFERSQDIFFIADTDLKLLDLNNAASRLLQYPKEWMVHKQLTDFVTFRQPHFSMAEELKKKGAIDNMEARLKTQAGNVLHVVLSATMEKDNSNKNYVQGFIHDITLQKKAELSRLQAEKLAATGRLVRTLAHEVRNPLNNINMSVEQLMSITEDEEADLYMSIIQRNSARINDLISELLNSSRPVDLRTERFSLQSLVHDTLESARDRITLQRIKVSENNEAPEVMITGDKEKLRLAFLNIIINAIEAMEPGQGKLSVDITMEDDQACVTISDNGSGIDPDSMPLLFEPYFTSKRNGMGLGLATTHNTIKMHNGMIEVDSTVGEGTTFYIFFPAAETATTQQT